MELVVLIAGGVQAIDEELKQLGQSYADKQAALQEAKRKKGRGFGFLYNALDQDDVNDMLVLKQDRCRRIYVLEEETLLDLFKRSGLISET